MAAVRDLADASQLREVIAVSNEVGGGIVPTTRVGRRFRDLQGWANQILAATADSVTLVVAGLPLALKSERRQLSGPLTRKSVLQRRGGAAGSMTPQRRSLRGATLPSWHEERTRRPADPWRSRSSHPGNLHRPVEDLSAVRFDALNRCRDIRHAEIDLPVWRHVRHLGRLVHHAANHPVRAVEHVVLAHRTHVQRLAWLPAEDLL